MNSDWYTIQNIEEVDSPSVVLYKGRLQFNIDTMIAMVGGNLDKLMPHVKTNKMSKVIESMIIKGIKRFKASTIAEAEIAAREGAGSVLIAHQLVGPKIQRFGELVTTFPKTKFSTIVDNLTSFRNLEKEAKERHVYFDVYIDINTGMNRSGIESGKELEELIKQSKKYIGLLFKPKWRILSKAHNIGMSLYIFFKEEIYWLLQ